ncbi:helix-turn-helix transcriptional regulator [Myroides odoratimimus]|uniref:AraC family transcriptional regulator n=1 Tax=Myroides odoratimimus TaxID=76832 RepID=UPI0025779451|nr:AraC family transcriptional regulator [Myroides odoratimimus]MDM1397762.1 helix-turn-helix transcriptional regulator [Myroides odoratimimus]
MRKGDQIVEFFELENMVTNEMYQSKKELVNDSGTFVTYHIFDSADIIIRQYYLKYTQDFALHYIFEEIEYVELSFFFGKHIVRDVINGTPNKYLPFHCYLSYLSTGSTADVIFEKDAVYEHLDIYLPLDFFNEWSQQDEIIAEFTTAIKNDQTCRLIKDIKLTQELLVLLNEIKTCSYKGMAKEMYTKGKVLEVISVLLHEREAGIEECSKLQLGVKLTPEDELILSNIKEFIDLNYREFYTTEELSKLFFMNEYKLKKGFKHLYNLGLFEYAQHRRMNIAIQKLEEAHHTIAEIAFDLGYSSSVAFSKAFKKHFGYPPKRFHLT